MSERKEFKKNNAEKRTAKAYYNAKHSEEIEKYNHIFTKRLKTARKKQNITQEKMAKKLDVSLATYRKYEQEGGNRTDTPYYLATLVNTLHVSADYLIGKSDTPHPEYNDIIKNTGLNEKSILQLQKLHALDGGEIYQGYLDFVNCFLGNESCTSIFFEGLLPILRELNEAMYGNYKSDRLTNIASANLADFVYNYITKVVVPTYSQLYNTGEYTPADVKQYLTDNAVTNKKKR